MVELKQFSLGYPHSSHRLTEDLYYLSAIFFASRDISKLRAYGEGEWSLFHSFRSVEISEISRRFVSVAGICRNIMDNTDPFFVPGEVIHEHGRRVVGQLYEPAGVRNGKVLVFREACNKILHARHLNFDTSDSTTFYSGYLKPLVYLYGYKTTRSKPKGASKKAMWKAKIHPIEFVRAAYDFCDL